MGGSSRCWLLRRGRRGAPVAAKNGNRGKCDRVASAGSAGSSNRTRLAVAVDESIAALRIKVAVGRVTCALLAAAFGDNSHCMRLAAGG